MWVFLLAADLRGKCPKNFYFSRSDLRNNCMKKSPLFLWLVTLLSVTHIFSSFTKGGNACCRVNAHDTAILPLFANAKDHRGLSTTNSNGFITFTTGLDNSYYLFDSVNRKGFLYLEIKTNRSDTESKKRIPLNISIVLDRSGSMAANDKMDFAKNAAKGIIDKLTGEDFVSVVVYDEFIDVVQTATPVLHKDSIKAKIEKIKPRGSTNLWGGSERGYEQVKNNYKKNYINRVLLISDGHITAGTKMPSRIIAKVQEYKDIEGISISTFGVGLDYNETLMTAMAENGAGNYYFINKGEEMTAMFEKELNGLMNVVAQNAELRITLPKGVTVEKLYPFKYAQVKNEIDINFRDLFPGESKGLVLKFSLDNQVEKEAKIFARLSYTDVVDNGAKWILNENLLLPTKHTDEYLTAFNKTVAEQVVLFMANENLENAMLEADKGNYETARKYAEINSNLFRLHNVYVQHSRELQKMDSVNSFYRKDLARAGKMSIDSVKLMQKGKRALNYQIRNKKQE